MGTPEREEGWSEREGRGGGGGREEWEGRRERVEEKGEGMRGVGSKGLEEEKRLNASWYGQ